MKILAIETTGGPSSAAVLDGNKIIGEFTLNNKVNHSETIMPIVESLMKMLDMALSSMDYIACSSGPGSFTGLRIGAATAKALAHGAKRPLVMVPTLDALAYNVLEKESLIIPIMDARRGQVYTAIYENNGKIIRKSDYMNIEFTELLSKIDKGGKAVFLGDGIVNYEDLIKERGYAIAPLNMNMQRAGSVALAASELIKEDKFSDYRDFELMYLRKPQAEREYEEKLIHDRNSTL
jgi:tRNA threonylcarbamoyladenosine biosynthesis protein TsaB